MLKCVITMTCRNGVNAQIIFCNVLMQSSKVASSVVEIEGIVECLAGGERRLCCVSLMVFYGSRSLEGGGHIAE